METLLDKQSNGNDCSWKVKLTKQIDGGGLFHTIYFEKNNTVILNYNGASNEYTHLIAILKHWLAGTPVDAPLSTEFRKEVVDFLILVS